MYIYVCYNNYILDIQALISNNLIYTFQCEY